MSLPENEIRSEFTVRSYEVDSYAHLNNGVYVAWFEQGRLLWLRSRGYTYDSLAAAKQWLVVARTEVDFRRPLVESNRVELSSCIVSLGRSSVRWLQIMRLLGPEAEVAERSAPVVAEATTVMVFSGEGKGSIPIPEHFRAAVEGSDAER
jgi:acyl-CoA thioester hydrolase